MSGHLRIAGALVALAAFSWNEPAPRGLARARADDPPSTVALDEIVVHLPRPEAAAPGSAATVVEAERFAGEVKGVAELVATAPGVAVREYGGLGKLATVSIRGASASGVKVLLDGIALDTGGGGGVNLASIPRGWIDAVEVVRGVEGARFGAGALGGAVNVLTPPAAGGRWSAQLHGGSFGTAHAAADVAIGDDGAGLLVAGSWDRTDGDFPYLHDRTPATRDDPLTRNVRRNNAGDAGGLLLKGTLRALGGRFDALALASAGDHALPTSQLAADAPGDTTRLLARQQDLRLAAVLRHARLLAPALRLTTELAARHERLEYRDDRGVTTDQRDRSASAKASVGATIGRHALEVAAAAGLERLDGAGLGETRDAPELSASLADELAIGPVRLGPAVRWDRHGDFSGASAKLGAAVRVAGPLSARASAGRTFRAPSLSELYLVQATLEPNPDLRPEESTGADASLVAEGRFGLASATGFVSLYEDLIAYESATAGRVKPFNLDRTLVRGVELEAGSVPRGPAGLSAQVAYTYQVATARRGSADVLGNDVPHRPRHRLFARLGAARGPLEAHAEAHHVGRQWRTARNLDAIDASTVFNAGISCRVSRRGDVRLHAEVRNLADDRTLHDGFGNPLPSRMILLGVRAGSTTKGMQ